MKVFAKSKRPQGHYRAGRFWPFAGTWARGLDEERLKMLRADRYIIVEVAKPVSEMTLEELRSYAATHGIDLGDAKNKSDVLAAIEGPAKA